MLKCIRLRSKLAKIDNWHLVIDEYIKCGYANCNFVEQFKNGQTSTPYYSQQ